MAASANAQDSVRRHAADGLDGDRSRPARSPRTGIRHAGRSSPRYGGRVKFENVEEGRPSPNRSTRSPVCPRWWSSTPKRAARRQDKRPTQVKVDQRRERLKRIAGTDHAVTITSGRRDRHRARDGQEVGVGDDVARIPLESQKTRDITGGLPRVAELFEARSPGCRHARRGHRHGVVRQGHQGKQRLVITDSDGNAHEFLIPKDKNVLVHDGRSRQQGRDDRRRPADPHDILRLRGIERWPVISPTRSRTSTAAGA